MHIINGREIARKIRDELLQEIAEKGLAPKLGVLLVGDDPASHLYVNLKEKAAAEIGIATDIRRLPAATSDDELKRIIKNWNRDAAVHGILVQLPLPEEHDTNAIIQEIDPRKDADGFHPTNVAALLEGRGKIIPPLHEGILRLIASTGMVMNGARATIVANSDIFSKPLDRLLRTAGAYTAILSPDDLHLSTLRDSQIIITAIGRPRVLTRDHIAPGAVVIDVGISTTAEKKIVGHVDAESVKDLPGWLSPVPGGVGPMTIAMLLKNVFSIAKDITLPSLPRATSQFSSAASREPQEGSPQSHSTS